MTVIWKGCKIYTIPVALFFRGKRYELNNRMIGRIGEDLAEAFLVSRDYTILERNFSCRSGEIDIICEKDDVIFIVEVKTRSTHKTGTGFEAVDERKRRHMKTCASVYLKMTQRNPAAVRFQVIEIFIDHRDCTVDFGEV